MDMALALELGEDKPSLSMKTTEGRTYTASDPNGAKKVIAKCRIEKSRAEIKERMWQGNIVSHRLADESLDLAECFNWSRKWRSAPSYTICAINEIMLQLVRTKVRENRWEKQRIHPTGFATNVLRLSKTSFRDAQNLPKDIICGDMMMS